VDDTGFEPVTSSMSLLFLSSFNLHQSYSNMG
jgi:hypothetical protein